MKRTWRVECFHGGLCKRNRKFTSPDAALHFVNNFLDDHYEEQWDVQVVMPSGQVHQMGINGNNTTNGWEV